MCSGSLCESWTSTCSTCSVIVSSQQIERREEEDPDEVDEVPIEANDLDAVGEALRLALPHLRAEGQKVGEDDHSAENVQAVQAGHREVDGEEVVRLREVLVREAQVVLVRLDQHEDQAAEQGDADEDPPHLQVAESEVRPRQNDRDRGEDQHE